MARNRESGDGRRQSRWRIAVWSVAALLLLLPLAAMQFTAEVNWSATDFALAAGLLISVCLAYELVVRRTGDVTYRTAIGVALAAAFILVWLSLGVGIIGRDGDPANLVYFGVLAIGIVGALIARFRPGGMARVLFAMALAQAAIGVVAVIFGLGYPWSGPLELTVLNGFFVALFVGSGWLFRRAALTRPGTEAV
jgi:hypothetical protein